MAKHENTTTTERINYYVIKLMKDDGEFYWTTRPSFHSSNYTKDIDFAKKYNNYDDAKRKAYIISENDKVTVHVIEYTITTTISYKDTIIPKE